MAAERTRPRAAWALPGGNGSARATSGTVTAMTDTRSPLSGPGPLTIRFALLLDAVVTGANGVAYLVAAGPIGDLLGLPADLLRAAGRRSSSPTPRSSCGS